MSPLFFFFFFFNDTATTEIYTLSLHDALPICECGGEQRGRFETDGHGVRPVVVRDGKERCPRRNVGGGGEPEVADAACGGARDRHHGFTPGRDPTGGGRAIARRDPRRETPVPR